MALNVAYTHSSTSSTLVVTVERMSDNYFWNPTAVAFQTPFNFANHKIALTEGTGAQLYSYTASVASLGSPGRVRVRVHDDGAADDHVIAVQETYVDGGNELGVDANVSNGILDTANGVETGYTVRQALRLIVSALAAKLSGAATSTVTIRDIGDTKARITATVDADGNRTAVTLDAS